PRPASGNHRGYLLPDGPQEVRPRRQLRDHRQYGKGGYRDLPAAGGRRDGRRSEPPDLDGGGQSRRGGVRDRRRAPDGAEPGEPVGELRTAYDLHGRPDARAAGTRSRKG